MNNHVTTIFINGLVWRSKFATVHNHSSAINQIKQRKREPKYLLHVVLSVLFVHIVKLMRTRKEENLAAKITCKILKENKIEGASAVSVSAQHLMRKMFLEPIVAHRSSQVHGTESQKRHNT